MENVVRSTNQWFDFNASNKTNSAKENNRENSDIKLAGRLDLISILENL